MHVYSLSLGGETEKRKEYLAVSPGSCSFPAAVQLICPFQHGALLGVDVLPLLNTFQIPPYLSTSFTSLTQHTWRQVQALLCFLSPPHCLENLTFLQKRSAHILSSLSQGKERVWQGRSYGSPTHEPGRTEQNRTSRRAGMPRRFIWLLFLAFDDTV